MAGTLTDRDPADAGRLRTAGRYARLADRAARQDGGVRAQRGRRPAPRPPPPRRHPPARAAEPGPASSATPSWTDDGAVSAGSPGGRPGSPAARRRPSAAGHAGRAGGHPAADLGHRQLARGPGARRRPPVSGPPRAADHEAGARTSAAARAPAPGRDHHPDLPPGHRRRSELAGGSTPRHSPTIPSRAGSARRTWPSGWPSRGSTRTDSSSPCADSTMVGFHWTKQHGDQLGEVYVLGVVPTAAGRASEGAAERSGCSTSTAGKHRGGALRRGRPSGRRRPVPGLWLPQLRTVM